jgi:hypothetical protein
MEWPLVVFLSVAAGCVAGFAAWLADTVLTIVVRWRRVKSMAKKAEDD